MVIQVNTIENVIVWRWHNLIFRLADLYFLSGCFPEKEGDSSLQTTAVFRLHRMLMSTSLRPL